MSEYDDLIERGNVHYINREYDEAIADYSKAIEIDANDSNAYGNRGVAYGEKGEHDLAIADFVKAIEIDANDSNAYYNRGVVYGEKGEYDEAIADYSKAIEIDPNNSKAYGNRGIAYGKKGEHDLAIADFVKVIEIDPNNSNAYGNRGVAYVEKGEHDLAIADFAKAIEIDQNNSNAYGNRGFAYGKKGEHDLAIADFAKAIEIDQNNLKAYINRGNAYGEKGEYDLAIADFVKAIEIDSIDSMVFVNENLEEILKSENYTFLWNIDDEKIKLFSHFFVRMIVKFRDNGFDSSEYQKLVKSVYTLWNSLKCGDTNTKIYQYTTQAVLNEMKETRKLRLTPASYQNDPEEGFVFYNYLICMLKQKNKWILEKIKQIKKDMDNDSIAFIRSFTTNEDSLVMWDSSYGQNGEGVSIGISRQKLNKGFGINNFKTINDITELNTRDTKVNSQSKESAVFKIEQTGLYEILYLDNKKAKGKLEDIKESLLKIPQEDWEKTDKEGNNVLIPLLSELFTSIAHLIKDSDYEHEHEYRLMHIGSIDDDKDFIKSSVNTGVYIETEPVLFDDPNDKEIIYFGPKVDTITFKRAKHAFEHEASKSGRVTVQVEQSKIQYR